MLRPRSRPAKELSPDMSHGSSIRRSIVIFMGIVNYSVNNGCAECRKISQGWDQRPPQEVSVLFPAAVRRHRECSKSVAYRRSPVVERVHVQRFVDGKLGHENQTLGLLDALARKVSLSYEDVSVGSRLSAVSDLIFGSLRVASQRGRRPHLLLGAGRGTHFPMLSARQRLGVPAVVLMAPSPAMMPFFDLCIVPQHDELVGPRVLTTLGTLTSVRPGSPGDPHRGLFLIGGPSQHHGWDENSLVDAVQAAVRQQPSLRWKLTTSRRTPASTTRRLAEIALPQIEVFPVETTGPAWLRQELSDASRTWVTEDSISMIFDSLTAGNWTGVLPVPRQRKRSRVYRCVDQLIESGHVCHEIPDPSVSAADPPSCGLDEASRIADLVLERFLLTPKRKVG